MANTAAKKITYDGKPVQVESAIRDGSGKVISSTYAPKSHATNGNTYGYGDATNAGHLRVGSNITVSNGTISLTKANVTSALGYTPPTTDTNTTYSAGYKLEMSGTTFNARKCVVGHSGNTLTYYWYKVASLSHSNVYTDYNISFKVWAGYADNSTRMGILTAHIRTNNTGYEGSQLVWEYAQSGIDQTHFVMLHSAAGSFPCNCEIWAYCKTSWQLYHFDVISEGDRAGFNKPWTLYTNVTDDEVSGQVGTAYTTGLTVQESTLGTLKNVAALASHTHNYAGSSSAGGAATSANKLNTDAGSATKPIYFEGGIPKVGTYTLGAACQNGVDNYSAVGALAGLTNWAGSTNLVTRNTIAYWDGSYQSTGHTSNLAYCKKGAFGTAATYNVETTLANDANLPTGAAVTTALAGKSNTDHTHTTSLATDTGTATVTLAHNTTYKLTAGGTSVIFKTPADNNTDTKARQTLQTGNYNLPLLMSYVQTSDTTTNRDGVTYRNNSIYANTSTGVITATGFSGDLTGDVTGDVVGSLTGNASTATAVSVSAPSAPAAGSSRTTYLALLPSTAPTQTPERSFAQVTVTRPTENQLWYTVSNMTAANANAVPWTGVTGKPDLYTAPEAVNTNMDSLESGFTFRTSTAILGKTSNWFVETFVNGGYKMQRATDLADPSNVCIRTKNGSSASWSTWTYSYAVWKV